MPAAGVSAAAASSANPLIGKGELISGIAELATDGFYGTSRPAQANSDKQKAKLEHDKALNRVVLEPISDHTELFRQFSDNPAKAMPWRPSTAP